MKIYTIGFTRKSAKSFFELLRDNNVKTVVDIRLNNTSQLAAFAKGEDLKFFLTEFCNIQYIHDTMFAPTEDLLKRYKNKEIAWQEYENIFEQIMEKRDIKGYIVKNYVNQDNVCLLCSEALPNQCHRRLVAETMKKTLNDVQIIHL